MKLQKLVAQSYLSLDSDCVYLHESVIAIKKVYLNHPRANESRREMVRDKFLLQKWRQDVAETLLRKLSTGLIACQSMHLWILRDLELYLSDDSLRLVSEILKRSPQAARLNEAFQELLIQQNRVHLFHDVAGPVVVPVAGPRCKLPVRPVLPSRWPHWRWCKDVEFSRYMFSDSGDAVTYRGIHYQPGDLLVTNMNLDSAGVYTLPCEPESFGAHLGIYAHLKRGDHIFPAVLEIYRNGLRALPLSTFLEPSFSAYIEVYRHKEMSRELRERFNLFVEPLMDEIEGYQYFTDHVSTTHGSCTDIANRLYVAVGFAPFLRQTFYRHPTILENMRHLEFHCQEVLTPVDFVTDGKMDLIGVVDNGLFNRELPRYCAGQALITVFRNSRLETDRMHAFYHLEVWAIKQIQKGSLTGKVIAFFNGFTLRDFPKGPASLIAFVEYLHRELARITERLQLPVMKILGEKPEPFDVYDFMESEAARKAILIHIRSLSRYFSSPKKDY